MRTKSFAQIQYKNYINYLDIINVEIISGQQTVSCVHSSDWAVVICVVARMFTFVNILLIMYFAPHKLIM